MNACVNARNSEGTELEVRRLERTLGLTATGLRPVSNQAVDDWLKG